MEKQTLVSSKKKMENRQKGNAKDCFVAKIVLHTWLVLLLATTMIFVLSPNTAFAKLSEANFRVGESTDCDWNWADAYKKKLTFRSSSGGGMAFPPQLSGFKITPNSSGVYKVSCEMGGGLPGNYMICAKNKDGTYVPLPIGTYVKGNPPQNAITNTGANNMATVYLQEGQEYAIFMVGDDGYEPLDNRNCKDEKGDLKLHVEKVPAPEGSRIMELEESSAKYTNSKFSSVRYPNWQESFGVGILGDKTYKHESIEQPDDSQAGDDNPNPGENPGENPEENPGENPGENPDENPGETPDIGVNEGDGTGDNQVDQGKASNVERVLTWFITWLGDCARSAINYAMQDDITVDGILFNNYPKTRLSIFQSERTGDSKNPFLEESGLLDNGGEKGLITKYFLFFRNISLIFYVAMLLYLGVRVLLVSTGSKKEKCKSMLADWVKGIIILVIFPYIMRYTIVLNDSIVEYIESVKSDKDLATGKSLFPSTNANLSETDAESLHAANSEAQKNGDIMSYVRAMAYDTGRMAYAILYMFLIKLLLGFIYMYFKRLLATIFLVIIFPLVSISYAIDRIADGKSQAFGNWYKEFVLNVFMQTFQAINYVIVMSVILALKPGSGVAFNVILAIIGLNYVSKGEEILRSMFTRMSGGGANSVPRSISEAAKTILNVKIATDLADKVKKVGKRIGNAWGSARKLGTSYYNVQEAKLAERDRQNMLALSRRQAALATNASAQDAQDKSMQELVQLASGIALNRKPDEVYDALGKIRAAQSDPMQKDSLAKAMAELSERDRAKIEMKLKGYDAINGTLYSMAKGNDGTYTEREINMNLSITMDIINKTTPIKPEGMTEEEYDTQREVYGDLYNYMATQKVSSKRGSSIVSLIQPITNYAKTRAITSLQQDKVDNSARLFGNSVTIDNSRYGADFSKTSDMNKVGRATYRASDSFNKIESTHSNASEVDALMNRYSTSTSATKIAEAERAANLVSRLKNAKQLTMTNDAGLSGAEGARILREWKELEEIAKDNEDVRAILNRIQESDRLDMETNELIAGADLGFGLEEFEAYQALTVISENDHEGAYSAEENQLLAEAMKTAKRIHDDENASKVAKIIINRAEIDDILHTDEKDISDMVANYLLPTQTQEEIRDIKEANMMAEEAERRYQDMKTKNLSQAKINLYGDTLNAVNATASATFGTVLEAAAATASGALFMGASGEDKPSKAVFAANRGIDLVEKVESIAPNTVPGNSGFGKKVGTATYGFVSRHFGSDRSMNDPILNDREQSMAIIQNMARQDASKKKINTVREGMERYRKRN